MAARLLARNASASSSFLIRANFRTSSVASSSQSCARQKIVSSESAGIDEESAKRNSLRKEIQEMVKRSKPKFKRVKESEPLNPVTDIKHQIREEVEITKERQKEETVIDAKHTRSQQVMAQVDKDWIKEAVAEKFEALIALRKFSIELYKAAIQPDQDLLAFVSHGPCLTPPIQDYKCPEGMSVNTTEDGIHRPASHVKMFTYLLQTKGSTPNNRHRIRERVNIEKGREHMENTIERGFDKRCFGMRRRDNEWITKAMFDQYEALGALRKFSFELHEAAIQPDPDLLPFTAHGPCFTPPIQNYECPEGVFINTKKSCSDSETKLNRREEDEESSDE